MFHIHVSVPITAPNIRLGIWHGPKTMPGLAAPALTPSCSCFAANARTSDSASPWYYHCTPSQSTLLLSVARDVREGGSFEVRKYEKWGTVGKGTYPREEILRRHLRLRSLIALGPSVAHIEESKRLGRPCLVHHLDASHGALQANASDFLFGATMSLTASEE